MLGHRDLPVQPFGVGTAACRDSFCLLWGLILQADLRVQHQALQVRMVEATLGTPFLINLDLGTTRSVTSEQVIVCPVHGVQKRAAMPLQPHRMPGASETSM